MKRILLCLLALTVLPLAAQAGFVESFDVTGANNTVVFRADSLYSARLVTPSGGSRLGNTYRNGYVVQNNDFAPFSGTAFGLISRDQSGNGNFLYNGTNNASASNYRGLVWGVTDPIPVEPNTDYVLSFYLANSTRRTGPTLNAAIIQPSINGKTIGAGVSAAGFFTDGNPRHRWQQFAYDWNSGNATTASIDLQNLTVTGNGNDFGLDTIAFLAVPEPSAIGLLGTCIGVLAGYWQVWRPGRGLIA